jgi:DNA-binding transcriptional ArsR family regulator
VRDTSLNLVYAAIADPTRRAILAALARGDAQVGELAARFPMSFNGVSKHVKVLERAGLVHRAVRGREHWLRANPSPLRGAARWLDQYQAFWEARLDALETVLIEQRDARAPSPTRRRKPRQAKRSSA